MQVSLRRCLPCCGRAQASAVGLGLVSHTFQCIGGNNLCRPGRSVTSGSPGAPLSTTQSKLFTFHRHQQHTVRKGTASRGAPRTIAMQPIHCTIRCHLPLVCRPQLPACPLPASEQGASRGAATSPSCGRGHPGWAATQIGSKYREASIHQACCRRQCVKYTQTMCFNH